MRTTMTGEAPDRDAQGQGAVARALATARSARRGGAAPSRGILSMQERGRRLAARALSGVRQVGVGIGVRPYQHDRWSDARWAEAYARQEFAYQRDVFELGRYAVLLGYLRRHGAGSILDVGCGEGLFRRLLSPADFTRYLGMDIVPGAVEHASVLADERTSFAVGELPDSDEHFDVVVLNEVLYYFHSADAILERVAAVLVPSGAVVTSIWRHAGDRALWRALDRRFQIVDAVRLRSEGNPYNRRGWRVSMHLRAE